jgi:hypothetical protein
MYGFCGLTFALVSWAAMAQQNPPEAVPVYQAPAVPTPPPAAPVAPVADPAANAAPPPASSPQRSDAELEKLVAPIALYPDPLIATILPASVYPLEIVQAARFVADTNNLANLDAQPWDDNVKAVARVPEVIQQMNDNLSWTMELGEAFLAQDKELMDSIQTLRFRAQEVGTLKTTPQQVVIVTNSLVERTYEQQVIYVTNTVVLVQPSNPSVVYVPYYNPVVVYAPPPGPPPVITFAAGITFGLIIANNCDWYYGGCYRGRYPPPPPRYPPPYRPPDGRPPGYRPPGYRPPPPGGRPPGGRPPGGKPDGGRPSTMPAASQRWKPDPNRMAKAGVPSRQSRETRGWGAGGASPATSIVQSPANAGSRPGGANSIVQRPGSAGGRPRTGTVPSFNQPTTRPSAGTAARPTTRPSTGPAARPSPRPSRNVAQPNRGPSYNRQAPSGSAFGGVRNGSSAHNFSNRGAASRGFSRGSGGRRR